MSYSEYKDLFDKAQEKGSYHMFIYDVVNSKNTLAKKDRSDILKLLFTVYSRLERIEEIEQRSILHKSSQLIRGKLKKKIENGIEYYEYDHLSGKDLETGKAYNEEPFNMIGDLYGFTIERNSLTAEQVDAIFEEEKVKLNIQQEFHKANGFYETDKYEEGDKLYFRGYCMQQLEEMSKQGKELDIER